MTTEQKIREAFIKYSGGHAPASFATSYLDFKAGYLALLKSLRYEAFLSEGCDLYHLPEGVKK